jgi:hypothetical protein
MFDSESITGGGKTFADSVTFQQYIKGMSMLPWENEISLSPYRGGIFGRARPTKHRAPKKPEINIDSLPSTQYDQMDEVIRLLHKLCRKVERLRPCDR